MVICCNILYNFIYSRELSHAHYEGGDELFLENKIS